MPKQVIHCLRLLSLEIVAGAVIGNYFIAKILHVNMPWPVPLILALGVWVIYTTDRLLDARQIPGTAHSARHQFHKKYVKILSLAVGLCILFAGLLLSYLPPKTLQFGLLFAVIIAGYFLLIIKPKIQSIVPKEIPAALLYTGGIFLGPVSLAESPFTTEVIILFTRYALIALANLLIFSLYEKQTDLADSLHSFAGTFGRKPTRVVLLVVFSLTGTISLIAFFVTKNPDTAATQTVIIAMTVVTALVAFFPKLFKPNNLYRIIGDGVFFIPLIYLIF